MSELRPEIRELMARTRSRAKPREEAAPFGFAARVVARARLGGQPSMLPFQRAFAAVSWVAALVIISCGLVLLQHRRADDPTLEIVAATQQFAETISP